MSKRDDELDAVFEAWEEWRRLKFRSDRTMAFADCHDTAQAWVRFQNLYLGDNNRLATLPSPSVVILPFGGQA